VLQHQIHPVSETELVTNFFEAHLGEEHLDVTPPFFVKLITREQTAFSFKSDTSVDETKVLQANIEYNLGAFVNTSTLLFSTTNGLTIYINGVELKDISNYDYPIRLTIKPNPPALVVQRFKPLQ
jgi:hypothetical protein